MRYTGPAFLHLTEDEVREVVRHVPLAHDIKSSRIAARMNAWLAYREATAELHGDNREVSWNQQTRSHDA